jgi:transposase
MAIALPDARQLSDEALETLRLRALRGIELGYHAAEMADVLGVTRETVSRWWTAYTSGGVDALPHDRSGRPLGSGRFLADEQASHIRSLIDGNTPEKLGIASALWTRRAVGALIHKEFGIELAERTVGEYLRRWNYTPKKPQRQARKQDPDEVQQWLALIYPALEKQAAEEDAEIHWCDETGVEADHHPGTGYSPKGQPATMEVPAPHIHMNQISTVTNEGAVRFMSYQGAMNTALFLVFLRRLLRSTTKKIFLITDRLKAHDGDAVHEWVEAHKDRIRLFYLPKYSPELNPAEYLNNDMKETVNASGLPDNKETLRSRMQRFMKRLLHLPEHVANYFLHPSIQYASAFEPCDSFIPR